MIRISELKQPLSGTRDDLLKSCAALLKIDPSRIASMELVRRSIDSRKKDDVHFVFTVDVALSGGEDARSGGGEGRVSSGSSDGTGDSSGVVSGGAVGCVGGTVGGCVGGSVGFGGRVIRK